MILSDDQVKAAVLKLLVMKGRWGAHYFPIDTLVNWTGKKIERNGRRALSKSLIQPLSRGSASTTTTYDHTQP